MGSAQHDNHPAGGTVARRAALLRGTAPLLLLGGLALLSGCASRDIGSLGDLVKSGGAAGYNVLLVTIDTARRDHFGCYGYGPALTPTIDALAAGGVLFDDAMTSVPLTLPSHTTILTGLSPLNHRVHDNGVYALGPEPSTLAEVLHAKGYETAAFIGCFVLDARFGLARGFDHYDFEVSRAGYRPQMVDFNERPANEVTDAVLGWIERRRQASTAAPFFAWVHYFDPHRPYLSPLQSLPAFRGKPYDAEIAFVDEQLGRVLSDLERGGELARTVVVVTADHGESLGEHKEQTHGMFIYNSTLHVPLIISCPALIRGPHTCRERLAGLVDIRPTLEDLLGLPASPDLDGQSLLRGIDRERSLYIETDGPLRMMGASPLRGLVTCHWKYILAPVPELYDLQHDPLETQNLEATATKRRESLQEQLTALLSRSPAGAQEPRPMTDEEIEKLASLGYVQATGLLNTDARPDPKDLIAGFNLGQQAEQLYTAGDYEQAASLARQALASCEECLNAVRVLAFSYLHLGRTPEALALLRESVARSQDVFLVRSLAQALIINQDCNAALEVLDLYATLAPGDGRVAMLRGDCCEQRGDPVAAIKEYKKARRLDENRVGIKAEEAIKRVQAKIGEYTGEN